MYKSIIIKIVLCILFFLCLLKLPYSYYQFVRIFSILGFSLLSFYSYIDRKVDSSIIYIFLILLFQPFIKIPLGRVVWNLIDIIVGLGLLISIFSSSLKNKN